MTGLEKILKSISDESERLASKIIEEANEQAQEILAQGKKEADDRAAELIKKAGDESKVIIEKAMNAAKIEKKKRILEAKQNHIKNLIEEAKISILRLPDEDYFTVILKMVEKFASSNSGEIVFSAKDQGRLTEDFLNKLNRIVKFKGGTLEVSKETRDFDGGFILVYGGIEENCSINALFENASDDLCDSFNKLLFT
ncbi:MAG: hypothetical protein K6E21_04290 [Bacilli bacterium]|nr:hypothetical protein [Bacilli bacterium]